MTDDSTHDSPRSLESIVVSGVTDLLAAGRDDIYRTVVRSMEKELFHAVLVHFKGNRLKASRALGISRFTLRKKLRALAAVEKPQ